MFEIKKENSISSLIVNQIIEQVKTGKLKEGDYLPTERELAKTLEVSRNTVREALCVLVNSGLVETAHRKPPKIVNRNLQAGLDIASIRFGNNVAYFKEIQKMRKIIEIGLIQDIFAHCSEENIRELRAINHKIKVAETVSYLARKDFQFHSRLIELSGNSMANAIYQTLSTSIIHIMEIGKGLTDGIEQAYEGHELIINAIEGKDTEALTDVLSKHVIYINQLVD